MVMRRLDTPLLCALNGAAAGYGMDLALGCDLVLASERARFVPPIRRGAVPESGGMVFDAVLETSSKQEGYYDETGEWIEGPFPGGFYDGDGVFRRGYYDQAGTFHPGYVDSNGEWVAAGACSVVPPCRDHRQYPACWRWRRRCGGISS